MSETTQIHGHEVMQMMVADEVSYSKETLCEAIIEKFGVEARFHTCSAEGMTAAELVQFLEAKGKFVPQGEGFSTSADKICSH